MLEALLLPAVGMIVGNWLDRRLGSDPWGTLAGGFFGLAGAGRILVLMIRRVNNDE